MKEELQKLINRWRHYADITRSDVTFETYIECAAHLEEVLRKFDTTDNPSQTLPKPVSQYLGRKE